MEVKIASRAGDEIEFVNHLTPSLQPYRLRGSSPIVTSAGFGDMAFQHVPGKGFDLWYSTYAISTPATLTGRADIPVPELHIPVKNRMHTRWDGIGELQMAGHEFDISFPTRRRNSSRSTGPYIVALSWMTAFDHRFVYGPGQKLPIGESYRHILPQQVVRIGPAKKTAAAPSLVVADGV